MSEIIVTKENFKEEVIDSALPVVLDFWAEWCGPCRMVSPILSELAEEYEGKVKVGKVNCDEQPELSAMFGVMNIPTLVRMEKGQPVSGMIGYRPRQELEGLFK